MRDRTTLVIAHRLSTVEKADRIIVLEAGASSRAARTPSCWRAAALYAQLHRMQFTRLKRVAWKRWLTRRVVRSESAPLVLRPLVLAVRRA